MPHVTEHTPKVSARSVKPYACESSREKRQQDRQTARQTDRQTHRRIVQNQFSRRFRGCTSQIRSYLEVDFLHDANTSIDMEVKYQIHSPCESNEGSTATRKAADNVNLDWRCLKSNVAGFGHFRLHRKRLGSVLLLQNCSLVFLHSTKLNSGGLTSPDEFKWLASNVVGFIPRNKNRA